MARRRRDDAAEKARREEIQRKIAGLEPEEGVELDEHALAKAYGYYRLQPRPDQLAKDYLQDWVNENGPNDLAQVLPRFPNWWVPSTVGWIARLKTRKNVLPNKSEGFFADQLEALRKKIPDAPRDDQPNRPRGPRYDPKVLEELEDLTPEQDVKNWLTSRMVGPFTLRRIVEVYTPRQEELQELLDTRRKLRKRDLAKFLKLLAEASDNGGTENLEAFYKSRGVTYASMTLVEGLIDLSDTNAEDNKSWFSKIVAAAEMILNNRDRSKAPRTPRTVPVDKIVALVKWAKKDETTGIASLPPQKVVGATMVWLYDCRDRVLKVINAKAGETLSFDRTSVSNVDPENSFLKRIRKPEQIIPGIAQGNKRFGLRSFEELKAPKYPLTVFRTNDHQIILKVY